MKVLGGSELDAIERAAQGDAIPEEQTHDPEAEARAALEALPARPLREHPDARAFIDGLRPGSHVLGEVVLDRIEELLAQYRSAAEMASRAGRQLPGHETVIAEALAVARLLVRDRKETR